MQHGGFQHQTQRDCNHESVFAYSLTITVLAVLLEDEDSQIAGSTTIMDFANTTMKQISLFSISDIVDFMHVLNNNVGRHKQLILTNLPTFAVFLVDIAKNTMNEKNKQRLVMAKDVDDLKNHIKPYSILPKELGGDLPESEHLARFMTDYEKNRSNIMEVFNNTKIDLSRVPDLKDFTNESVGSFRKLDID